MHHPRQGADGKSPPAPCLTTSVYPSVRKGVSNYDALLTVMKANRSTLGQCFAGIMQSPVMNTLYRGTQKISYYTFNTLKILVIPLYTVIPRLTSDPANEFSANEDFFAVFRTRLTSMDSANECFSGCAR